MLSYFNKISLQIKKYGKFIEFYQKIYRIILNAITLKILIDWVRDPVLRVAAICFAPQQKPITAEDDDPQSGGH